MEKFDPVKWFDQMKDVSYALTIRRWIETFSAIENVTAISANAEIFELLFDKGGVQIDQAFKKYIPSPVTDVTITLKDESVHTVSYIQTGELFKQKNSSQFADALTRVLVES